MANNHNVSPNMIGVALGGLLGLAHLGWATLVALGLGQAVLDTVLELHMIKPTIEVGAFAPEYAIGLVLVTTGIGYIVGFLFGLIWNAARKSA